MKTQTKGNALLARLSHHATGAIERGEAQAIAGIPAKEVRPRKNTKAIHAAFLLALAGECDALEFEKVEHSYIEGAPAYRVLTKAGFYTFAPDHPIGGESRPSYWVGACGRFEHPELAKDLCDCNPYSGKWNWIGYSSCTVKEAQAYATYIVSRILRLIS